MTFEKKEFAAIVRLAISMAAADGVFAENEKKAIALELARLGVSESNMSSFCLLQRKQWMLQIASLRYLT